MEPSQIATDEEWPGLRRAMEEISLVEGRLHDEGFSQMAFFMGVSNLGITGYVLGRFPEHIWVLYIAKTAILIPAWLREVSRRYNGFLFVLDYCWAINICLATCKFEK